MPASRSVATICLRDLHAVGVEHRDDHRARARLFVELAERVSAACRRDTPMEKPVAGTGSPRKRDDQPVVAPAAADRAEAHRPALLVLDLEQVSSTS